MPNGPSILTRRSQRGERSSTIADATSDTFQSAPAPLGITRRFQANNQGLIGDDVSSVPTTLDNVKVSHRRLIRSGGAGSATASGYPTNDETTHIPGFAVGDAR